MTQPEQITMGTDALRDALAAAYECGCKDVHENYEAVQDPEFGEAASDYAHCAVAPIVEAAAPTPLVEVEKPWPLSGYAPGNYLCNCVSCESRFTGDKRAIRCLECAAKQSKADRRSQAQRIAELEGERDEAERFSEAQIADNVILGKRAQAAEAERDEARAGLEKAREALEAVGQQAFCYCLSGDRIYHKPGCFVPLIIASLNTGARSEKEGEA